MQVHAAATTHVGVVRSENQDCLALAGWSTQLSGARLDLELPPGTSAAVIDGMGGHPGGDHASRTAAHAIGMHRLGAATHPDEVGALVQRVSDTVRETGQATEGHAAMGATIAGVVVTEDALLLFNVGDCSILRIRDGYVGQLAVIDRVDPTGRSSMIGQCLGGSPQPTAVDAHPDRFVPVGPERLVLCSDGLTDCVPNATIATVAASGVPRGDAARGLVAAAIRAGAPDNVSVIVVDVAPGADAEPTNDSGEPTRADLPPS